MSYLIDEYYFDRKDNYETYGIAFDKDNIFEEDGKKFLIMNKENDFIYFIGVEDFYDRRTLPEWQSRNGQFNSDKKQREYCDKILLDDLPKKKSEINEETKNKEEKKREIVKSIKDGRLKLKLINPSVFNSNDVFYSTLNFKDRDYPEFELIENSLNPTVIIN